MTRSYLLRTYEARWKRFQKAMKLAKISSQRELARRLGIKGPSVNGWANGKHLPDMEHVLQLAEWSGLCVEWLWLGRGSERPLQALNQKQMKAMDIVSDLTDQQFDRLVLIEGYVRSLPDTE